MPGRKGQVHRVVQEDTVREQAWQNMRYFGAEGFSIRRLVMTVPGANHDNIRKWLTRLERHRVIQKTHSAAPQRGEPASYVIARETRLHPVVCTRCGKSITAGECRPEEPGSGGDA